MDFSASADKIQEISSKVNEYVDKIEEIKNKYVKKINDFLEELETTINSIVTKGLQWVEIHVKKILKEINDVLANLHAKINNIINQLKEWYNIQINNIKRAFVKSICAKLGVECDNKTAELLTETIPHPSIDSLLPKTNLDLQLPDISNLAEIGQVTIPRLEI